MNSEKRIELDMLNDIALKNNELVNTQRILAKKNAEIEKLNLELKNLNSDLEQFTSIASHDMQEPLRMITGFLELIKTRYGPQLDEKGNSFIDFALNGGKRMQEMITSLLEITRASRDTGFREEVPLADILQEVQQYLSRLIEEKNAAIIIENQLPALLVSRSGISQIFQNLISNAIKFSEPSREPVVSITAMEKEGEWLFKVSDNGIGVDSVNGNVFEFFGRAKTAHTYDGYGIGLSICKKVVEKHGGKIWIETKEEPGSVFCFTLAKGEGS